MSPRAIGFLHRDVRNVGQWFARRGIAFDPDVELVDLLSSAFS